MSEAIRYRNNAFDAIYDLSSEELRNAVHASNTVNASYERSIYMNTITLTVLPSISNLITEKREPKRFAKKLQISIYLLFVGAVIGIAGAISFLLVPFAALFSLVAGIAVLSIYNRK